MGKTKLYLLSTFSFLLVSVALLAALELLVRHLKLRNAGDETRNHVVETSYMPVKLKSNHQGRIWNRSFSTNQHGFRGEPDFSLRPTKGEFRILSLGDSIGVGLGIEPFHHYTKVLERDLNRQCTRRRFHVINAGGQGYSPSSYYVYLKYEGLRFRPQMVIVEIEMCNDITDEALLNWDFQEGDRTHPYRVRGGRYVVGWDGNLLTTYSLGPHFFEKTYTYTLLWRHLLSLLYWLHPVPPFATEPGLPYYSLGFDRFLLDEVRIESGWRKTFASLQATHEVLRDRGIPFLLMILPARYVFHPQSDQRRAPARRLLDLAKQKEIPYLDFTASIEAGGGPRLYSDFVHLTEEGNHVVGEELFTHLAPELGVALLRK